MKQSNNTNKQKEKSGGIGNSKFRDTGGRMIFENPTLCSQFLREYTGVECLKNVRPEDIEDMTERFIQPFAEERESDVVKRVNLPDMGEFFVIALIEHKSSVDYNVVMQMFHYMSLIWTDYEKKAESEKKGITKSKDFKYPPILPIVYYEDTATWTAAINLKDRIFLSDVFGEYLPDYRYMLFKLQEQGETELISRNDEISFIMLINKLRNASEFGRIHFPDGYLDDIRNKAPSDVVDVLIKLVVAYLSEINCSDDEIYDVTDQIRRGDMNRLFENFHGYDIQATRRESRAEGREEHTIEQVCKKLRKGRSIAQIADELEEDEIRIKTICDAAEEFAPDYDEAKVKEKLIPAAVEN